MIDHLAASEDARFLNVHWESGGFSTLSAEALRREAQDAWSRRERIDHGAVTVAPDLRITGLHAVGAYGVNVHFSDGHDKAIYPFPYLRTLSEANDK